MPKTIALAWKDALVRFANRSELLFFIILPVAFTVLLAGVAVPGGGAADQRLPVAVADGDGSRLSAELLAALAASTAVRAELLPAQEAAAAFAGGDVLALLTIPPGFEGDLLRGRALALDLQTLPNDINGLVVTQAVDEAAAVMSRPLEAARQATEQRELLEPFADEAARQAAFAAALAAARALDAGAVPHLLLTEPQTAVSGDEESRPQQQAVGQLVSWVLIPLLGIAAWMAYERENGTLRRMAATPTSRSTYFLGTISGQVLTAGVQIALLLGFGGLVMGLDWGDSPLGLALMLASFTLAGAAMGTALGAFTRSTGQARSMSILGGMVMALLGGAWVPMEVFPAGVQTAVKLLPTTWAMQGLLDVVIRGGGVQDVLQETAVLLGFAVLFFAIGVRRFRFE